MANFLITTPNSLTQGTDTQDLFDLRTGAGVSVVAAGGADVISAAATGFTAANIQAGAGNDTVTFSTTGAVLDNAAILLGGGNDILTIVSGAAAGTSSAGGGVDITGGGGNDSITILSGNFAGGSSINGNQGSDTITISGSYANSLIAGGGDNDFIYFGGDLSASTINGGGGNDSITLAGDIDGSRIEGDTLNDSQWFGNDTIAIIDGATFGSGSLLQGGQGNDLIVMSGTFTTGASIEGNAGTDSIFISGFVASGGTFVGGGGGNDTITVSATLLSNFGTIQGGGGNDSISVSGGGANGGFIFGGAGADTINLGTVASAASTTGVNVAFASFSESTLGSVDIVNASGGVTGGSFMVNQSVTNFSVVTFSGSGVDGNAAGFATFSGGDDNLTARATLLDATLAQGNAVTFQAAGATYLFVQGGSANSGVTNDLIVQLGNDASSFGATTGSITRVSNSQLRVNFV